MKTMSERIRQDARERLDRLWALSVVVGQTAVAAAIAWEIAGRVVGRPEPVFAPVAAVITLGIATGQRFRRALELVLGVTLGVALGDLLIYLIGSGGWQIGVAVALAMMVTVAVGGTATVVAQAAISAVLVAALAPPEGGIYFSRVVDAFVGGTVALVVMAIVLPVNPLTVVSRVARPAMGVLIDGLTATARGLEDNDVRPAHEALVMLTEGEEKLAEYHEVLPEAREVATVAPLRWPTRNALRRYVESADYLERAVRNARVLARRGVTLLRDREPAPGELVASLRALADAVSVVRRDLRRGRVPYDATDLVLRAVWEASLAYRRGVGFSGSVVIAQIRAIGTDLLGTTGLPHDEADREIRRVAGTLGDSRPPG